MSGNFRPPRSPNIIWPSLSSLLIHYGRQWPEMLTRPKTLNILYIHIVYCTLFSSMLVRKATGSYRTYSIPGKTAGLFLSLRWKTCLRQNSSLGSCVCSEGSALRQNTDDNDDNFWASNSWLWFPPEGKQSGWYRVVDLRHVKEPQAEIRTFELNFSVFSRSL